MGKELVKTLNDLISTLRDSEEGFDKAAKGVHSDDLRAAFDAISVKRAKFAEELAGHVERLGGKPEVAGQGGGPRRKGWSGLDQSVRSKDDAAFLANCQRGEETTLKHFSHALEQDMPDDLRPIVEAQRISIQRAVEQLERMERVQRAG